MADAFGIAGLERDYGFALGEEGSIGHEASGTVLGGSTLPVARLHEGGLGVLGGRRITPLAAEDGTRWRSRATQIRRNIEKNQ